MRFCRFGDNRYGVLDGEDVVDVTSVVTSVIGRGKEVRFGDPFFANLDGIVEALGQSFGAGPRLPVNEAKLLCPVKAPSKVIAAPVNYREHVREMQESNLPGANNVLDIGSAGLFLKATSSLVGPSEGIALRFPERRTDFEVELVVIMGRAVSDVLRDNALDYVAGYSLGVDITLRGLEDRSFRKSIDSYSVVGPWFTTANEVSDPDNLRITLHQNGRLKQDASTSDMVYDVARLIEFASSYYTLYPGDIIFTGTPQGVGPIVAGDTLLAASPELGEMVVKVRPAG